jgi:hypothetical protein
MRLIETDEELRQHIEASLRGMAKIALERSQESRRRHDAEADARRKTIWKREAEAELRIAKAISDECEALLKMVERS